MNTRILLDITHNINDMAQFGNIPSSTVLLKGCPLHIVGGLTGQHNLLLMVITQISVTIESIKKVTCVQNEAFKIKTARVTYVYITQIPKSIN